MKKIILCYFLPFSLLKELKTSPYMNVLINISKKFESIFLVNTENLISTKIKTKKFYRIHKNFININPKNYTDLNKFTAKKKIIVINSIPRNLEHFRLLLYLTFKKIPKLEISNLGNIQKGTEVFIGKFNIKYFKLLITKYIPRKIIHLLAMIGILSKVDCKFTSNKKLEINFKKNNKIRSYYKDIRHVKSTIYENTVNQNIEEKYIVLIDVYPLYSQMTEYKKINNNHIIEHYKKLGTLLNHLKKILKKRIAVCIHPAYPEKFYAKYLSGFTIYKYRTNEFIKKSFIVLTFNSSSIINAIKYDKRIISIQSKIFKEKKYSSSIYQEELKTKKITLSEKYNFNSRKLIIELDKKIKNYKNYKTNYLGFNQKRKSSDIIFKYTMEKYN
jgi:hypothetical protein